MGDDLGNLRAEDEFLWRESVPAQHRAGLRERIECGIDLGGWKYLRVVFQFALGRGWIEYPYPFWVRPPGRP